MRSWRRACWSTPRTTSTVPSASSSACFVPVEPSSRASRTTTRWRPAGALTSLYPLVRLAKRILRSRRPRTSSDAARLVLALPGGARAARAHRRERGARGEGAVRLAGQEGSRVRRGLAVAAFAAAATAAALAAGPGDDQHRCGQRRGRARRSGRRSGDGGAGRSPARPLLRLGGRLPRRRAVRACRAARCSRRANLPRGRNRPAGLLGRRRPCDRCTALRRPRGRADAGRRLRSRRHGEQPHSQGVAVRHDHDHCRHGCGGLLGRRRSGGRGARSRGHEVSPRFRTARFSSPTRATTACGAYRRRASSRPSRGSGAPGFSGDGGPAPAAQLNLPFSVSPLAKGGFLIADAGNGRVRRVAANGTITTVAKLPAPHAVAALPDGSFLVTDTNGNRVLRVRAVDDFTTCGRHRDGGLLGRRRPRGRGGAQSAEGARRARRSVGVPRRRLREQPRAAGEDRPAARARAARRREEAAHDRRPSGDAPLHAVRAGCDPARGRAARLRRPAREDSRARPARTP